MSSATAARPALMTVQRVVATPRIAARQLLVLGVLLAVGAAYANHFANSFHFDDFHSVVNNPAIRSLSNIPRFFTDVRTSSILPSNRAWRPLVTTSFAIDYWLGGGLKPAAFHASTFLLFLLQTWVVFLVFERLLGSRWTAAFGAALYGLHPVCAETVNYVNQRAEIYSTLGVAGALYLYIARPDWRRYGAYLIPFGAALLSKAPALVFPALLLAYVYLFQQRDLKFAVRSAVPSLLATAVLGGLQIYMTPATFVAGASSAAAYRWTQPYVALRYFENFLAPVRLSADTDLAALPSAAQPEALAGFVFLALVAAAAWYCSRRVVLAPVAFGLWWFLLALLPTSVFPLAEVENDHRLFFPLVGLAMAAACILALTVPRSPRWITAVAALVLLAGCAYGTHQRNEVWKDEASLWRDVTLKSPSNGRGLMNYGLTLMGRGDMNGALGYLERARQFTPNYHLLEINLGIATGELRRDVEAEAHFQRALALAPNDSVSHYYYARWLDGHGRSAEGLARARIADSLNPSNPDARNLITAIETRQRIGTTELDRLEQAVSAVPNAEAYLNLSLKYHQAGRFEDCIRTAREALRLKPDYAEAYNNIAAGFESLGRWDDAIAAARQAVRLKPDFVLARNNLAWSESQRLRQTPPKR